VAVGATFYYDFLSPYCYLAAERIDELIPDAAWKPIAYPILLGRQGRLEQAIEEMAPVPTAAEVSRRAGERGLPPFAPPATWPAEAWSLTPMRAALFADQRGRLRGFSKAAYRKAFVESRALTEIESVLAAARDAGLDPGEVEEAIHRPEIKDGLKSNTDEAFDRGVTGIPTVAVGDELFWGDDRLDEAATAARR
jgi:2-hydroxychromene-2-carboxylate isomerase